MKKESKISDMNVVMFDIGDVKPYGNNPRINDGAVDYVKESIRQFGFKIPIVVDENHVILAGHTRLKAAIALHMDKVPVIVAEGLTDEKKNAYRIADNRAGELTLFDFDKLASEIGQIKLEAADIDLTAFGFEPIQNASKTTSKDCQGDEGIVYCPRCGKVVTGGKCDQNEDAEESEGEE